MGCFPCLTPRRKDVENYDHNTGCRSVESSGFHFLSFLLFCAMCLTLTILGERQIGMGMV